MRVRMGSYFPARHRVARQGTFPAGTSRQDTSGASVSRPREKRDKVIKEMQQWIILKYLEVLNTHTHTHSYVEIYRQNEVEKKESREFEKGGKGEGTDPPSPPAPATANADQHNTRWLREREVKPYNTIQTIIIYV